jgi:hypothetical protein
MGVVDVVDGLGLGFERSGDLLGLQAAWLAWRRGSS